VRVVVFFGLGGGGDYVHGMFGLFNVNKPVGPTSHDVVASVRRLIGRKIKVGHAGTLDPFASGVLVLCVGPATRLADTVQSQPKRYVAEVTLGVTSATDDTEGPITPTPAAGPVSEARVRDVLVRFVGRIMQVPPAHSAVHVDGRRAYKLARKGERVDLPPRPVTVHAVELLRCDAGRLELDVRCGSGAYIRSLARDIGAALGVGGYCSCLVRTAIGDFRVEDAIAPDVLDPQRHLLPAVLAVATMPKITAAAADREQLARGRAIHLEQAPPAPAGSEIAVIDARGRLLAIATLDAGGRLRPAKVFCR